MTVDQLLAPYRSINFRDGVLWALAYEQGIKPGTDLNRGQAAAYASFINAWVRRLWDSADFSEWTSIHSYAPNAKHIIPWNALPTDVQVGRDTPLIGKALKIYPIDPRITHFPCDIRFRLTEEGIHVGFDHGSVVWLKFVTRCPEFTSEEWDSTRAYGRGNLTYSPTTGEVYRSKSNQNRGHDPAGPAFSPPIGGHSPITEEQQRFVPDSTGIQAQSKILKLLFDPPTMGDPPPNGTYFSIVVLDVAGLPIGSPVVYTANGTDSLSTVISAIRALLAATLTGFSVTSDATSISLEDDQDFSFEQHTIWTNPAGKLHYFKIVQVQAYVAALASADGQPQITFVTFSQDQIIPGATYVVNFTGSDSSEHVATYEALPTDSGPQIVAGIAAAISAQTLDALFQQTLITTDPVTPTITFEVRQQHSVSIDIVAPGTSYWVLVPFPFHLADPVIRGVLSTELRAEGQNEKADGEEAKVPTETQLRIAAQTSKQYDVISDQQTPTSRYSIK